MYAMKVCKVDECYRTDLATRSALCKGHHNEYTRQHYRDNKQAYIDKAKKRNAEVKAKHLRIVIEHLRSNPCIDCGHDDIEVLQFDHRVPSEKVTEISNLLTGATERLIDEINKCDVRCAHCHIKKTRRQFGWWTTESLGL